MTTDKIFLFFTANPFPFWKPSLLELKGFIHTPAKKELSAGPYGDVRKTVSG